LSTQSQTIKLEVVTTDGATQIHEWPRDSQTEATVMALLSDYCKMVNEGRYGVIILNQPSEIDTLIAAALPEVPSTGYLPMAIYNAAYVVRLRLT